MSLLVLCVGTSARRPSLGRLPVVGRTRQLLQYALPRSAVSVGAAVQQFGWGAAVGCRTPRTRNSMMVRYTACRLRYRMPMTMWDIMIVSLRLYRVVWRALNSCTTTRAEPVWSSVCLPVIRHCGYRLVRKHPRPPHCTGSKMKIRQNGNEMRTRDVSAENTFFSNRGGVRAVPVRDPQHFFANLPGLTQGESPWINPKNRIAPAQRRAERG